MANFIEGKYFTEEQWQYWGGLFAQLLNFKIYRELRGDEIYFKTQLRFFSEKQDLVNHVAGNFGGLITRKRGFGQRNDRFEWSINEAATGLAFLENLEPYLPYHNVEAKIMMDYLYLRVLGKETGSKNIDEAGYTYYYEELKEAKSRPLSAKIWLPSNPTLAGMLDGGGSLTIIENENIFSPHTYLSSEHKSITQAIQEEYGGSFGEDKNMYHWLGIHRIARRFVEDVLPHLVLLKRQANLLIFFAKLAPDLSRSSKMYGRLPELAEVLGKYSSEDFDLVEILRLGLLTKMAQLQGKTLV